MSSSSETHSFPKDITLTDGPRTSYTVSLGDAIVGGFGDTAEQAVAALKRIAGALERLADAKEKKDA